MSMRTGEYPDDWDDRRERVLERDDYQCQRCGATDTTLHVHHVTPISKGGSHRLSNLETLCESCHAEEHPVQTTLRSALAQNRRIKMKYHSSSGTRIREVDPYGVEVHEGIQYMVGHDYYRDEIRHFRPTRIEWVTMTDTEFFPPAEFDTTAYLSRNLKSRQKSRQGSSECFVATAAYGTPHAQEIDRLREFRDGVLLQRPLGALAVDAYYRCSPPIAGWISRKEWRRKLVRTVVIEPALHFASLWKAN